jgi:hypothetical protein
VHTIDFELRAIHEKAPHTFRHAGLLALGAHGVRNIGQAMNSELRAIQKPRLGTKHKAIGRLNAHGVLGIERAMDFELRAIQKTPYRLPCLYGVGMD